MMARPGQTSHRPTPMRVELAAHLAARLFHDPPALGACNRRTARYISRTLHPALRGSGLQEGGGRGVVSAMSCAHRRICGMAHSGSRSQAVLATAEHERAASRSAMEAGEARNEAVKVATYSSVAAVIILVAPFLARLAAESAFHGSRK